MTRNGLGRNSIGWIRPTTAALVLLCGLAPAGLAQNIRLSPTSLTFNATQGGPAPPNQTVTVSNMAGPPFNFTASVTQGEGWLSVSPTSAGTTAELTVSVTVTGLAPGTYSGAIRIASESANNSPQTITVTLNVNPAPEIQLSPPNLSFNAVEGGPSPASQPVNVASSGANFSFTASASSAGSWLSVSSSSPTTPATLTVSVNSSGLAAGTYNGTVTVTAPTAGNSPRTIGVTLTVGAPAPNIQLSPTSLSFNAVEGGASPSGQTVNVTSSGANFDLTASASTTSGGAWLSVNSSSPTTPATLTVSVNSSGLAAGTYSGTVTVTAPTAGNSPRTIGVTLTVGAPAPNIQLSPTSLSFNAVEGGASPSGQTVNVTSSGANFDFTASASTTSGGAWLSVNSSSPTTPATLTVSVNSSGLAAGTYNGTVTVTAPTAGNSPRTIGVTLTVGAPAPNIQLAPTSLSFNAVEGGASPSGQTVNVTSSGANFDFTASASSGGAWLSVNSSSPTTPATLTVSVNSSGLAAGTYNGTVTVTAPAAGNSPRTIGVTLTVGAPAPNIQLAPTSLSFDGLEGGASPSGQTVNVTSSGANFDFTASASSGGAWLSVNSSSLSTPATLTVSVNSSGLAAGTYSGTITVTAPTAGNSPQTLAVTLTVDAPAPPPPDLALSTTSLSFSYLEGDPAPAGQAVRVTSSGSALDFTASASVSSPAGGNWLLVAPNQGATPSDIHVSVNPAGLAAGSYSGTVTIASGQAANSPRTVNVTLAVTRRQMQVAPTSLTFSHQVGASAPPGQTLQVSSSGAPFNFVVSNISTDSGGNWLFVTPGAGTTPLSLSVTVNPASLAAGSYQGQITLTSPQAGNSPVVVPVTLSVSAQPALQVAPLNLTFHYEQGGTVPAGQPVTIGSSSQALAFTATPSPGGSWLLQALSGGSPTGQPVSGNTPATLSVSVNPAGLATGTYPGSITLTSAQAGNSPQTINVTLVVAAPPASQPVIQTGSPLPSGQAGTPYSQSLTATGGTPPYVSWNVTQGSLPPGVALSTAGVLAGTPSQAGTYGFTLQVTDSAGETGSKAFQLSISAAGLTFTTSATLPRGTQGSPYSQALAASGGLPPYSFAVAPGSSLPPGLELSGAGVLSGTPAAAAVYTFALQVRDSRDQTASRSFEITIEPPPPSITTASALPGALGAPYSVIFQAEGGTPPYRWTALTALPPGLNLDSVSGALSGTPTQLGTLTFTVQVADGALRSSSKQFTFTVEGGALSISPATLPEGRLGESFSQTLTALGGSGSYSWRIAAGSLPAGVSLSASGVLTGVPAAAGSFSFTVEATDSGTLRGVRSYTLAVSAPPLPVSSMQGLAATADPAQQPRLSLNLAAPYPGPLTGQLMLTFQPDAVNQADDPGVQFSSGGRTATFEIPAGQTQAVFSGGSLAVQTGTVAGTIRVEARVFAGRAEVTPSPAPAIETRVNRLAPVIRSLTLQRVTGGFQARIAGFSTPRALRDATFRFTARQGANLQTTQLTVQLGEPSTQWYQGETSRGFGSQFTLTIPFNVSGDGNDIVSVSVTMANDQGASNEASATF